jgi:hypothetical protein
MVEDTRYLDDGVRGYIVNKARKEFWRVQSWYELGDLVNDGWLIFCECRERFGKRIKVKGDAAEFMAYFKRAYDNHIIDLANSRTRTTETNATDAGVDDLSMLDPTPVPECATVAALIARMPQELAALIKGLMAIDENEPYHRTRVREKVVGTVTRVVQTENGCEERVLGQVVRVVRRRRAIRETNQQRYARLLGCPDAEKRVTEWLLA